MVMVMVMVVVVIVVMVVVVMMVMTGPLLGEDEVVEGHLVDRRHAGLRRVVPRVPQAVGRRDKARDGIATGPLATLVLWCHRRATAAERPALESLI